MKKQSGSKKFRTAAHFLPGLILLALAVGFTVLVKLVDVQSIGPQGFSVGFAALNGWVHRLFGVNMLWYHITDWLGLVPVLTAVAFALVGLVQLVRRRSLFKVNRSLLMLGGFYVVVLGVYLFFEHCIINYRPVLMQGQLEASYPSSHTMLVLCLMSAAVLECRELAPQRVIFNRVVQVLSALVILVTVAGRLVSGVHWCTDILGGVLYSAALVALFAACLRTFCRQPCRVK